MKNALKVLIAASGLSVGVASVAYAQVQQCDAPIPDTIRCRNANSTLQALPNALDTSAAANLPAGRQFTHKVKFEAGTANAQGVILDANGNRVDACVRASDATLDNAFGATKVCTLATAVPGAKYRVAIL
jgi:hypothetical protein